MLWRGDSLFLVRRRILKLSTDEEPANAVRAVTDLPRHPFPVALSRELADENGRMLFEFAFGPERETALGNILHGDMY